MNITWWQSLLIAIGPAIITAFISWFISHTQINNAKKEFEKATGTKVIPNANAKNKILLDTNS